MLELFHSGLNWHGKGQTSVLRRISRNVKTEFAPRDPLMFERSSRVLWSRKSTLSNRYRASLFSHWSGIPPNFNMAGNMASDVEPNEAARRWCKLGVEVELTGQLWKALGLVAAAQSWQSTVDVHVVVARVLGCVGCRTEEP